MKRFELPQVRLSRLQTAQEWLDRCRPLFQTDPADFDLIGGIAKHTLQLPDKNGCRFAVVETPSAVVLQAVIRIEDDAPTIFSSILASDREYESEIAAETFAAFQTDDFADWGIKYARGECSVPTLAD